MVATTDARLFHHWQPEAYERAAERAASVGNLSSREPKSYFAADLVAGFCLRCGMEAWRCTSCNSLRCACRRQAGEGMRQHYEEDGRSRVYTGTRAAVLDADGYAVIQEPSMALQIVAYMGRQVIRVTSSSREEL